MMSEGDYYGENRVVENVHGNCISVKNDVLYIYRKKSLRSQRKPLKIVICDRDFCIPPFSV